MFLTVNHFQMFKPGSVNGRREVLETETKEPIKSIKIASNFTKRQEMAKEDTVHIKTCKATK